MKLCPHCEFIYEDEQSFCDMDGKELIHNPASESTRSRLIIPLVAEPRPSGRRSGSVVMSSLVVIVLASLVVVTYVARTRQTRIQPPQLTQASLQATEQTIQSSTQSTSHPSSDTVTVDQISALPASEQSIAATSAAPEQPDIKPASFETSSAKTQLAHSRLNAGQVSASPVTANSRGPVVIRLTNGAVIKADEAWEKKEGVWYRQGGMVTFLKPSHVQTIERGGGSPHSQATAGTALATNKPKQSANNATRDPLRIAKLEPVKPKKDSRVASFLKKTGNLLKKQFRL